ncbi:MAG: GNAT family N-acetyltransferase [Lachnospiraceae bacterium]|nr:GNAT family N-acetyltransferase [Lachnospiraceae bacterium]
MLYTYTTERLTLKILGQDSAPLTTEFFLRNQEHFSRWEIDHPEEYYSVPYQQRVLAAEETQFLRSQAVRYYLFAADGVASDGRILNGVTPVGTVCFQHICPAPDGSCRLGYRLDAAHTGRGYMTEALLCLIPKIFFYYRLHRIEADILPENLSSLRLVQRLGFTQEGVARGRYFCGGMYRDYLRYSLLSDDSFPPSR